MSEFRKVKVTASHIRRGIRGNPFSCPIALSVRTKGRVCVDPARMVISFDDVEWIYDLPQSAERFTYRFDEGKPVEPFVFQAQLLGKHLL